MSLITVVGMDPSMRNWGIARGTYCTDTGKVAIQEVDITQTKPPVKGKQVRVNSQDLECAKHLYAGAKAAFQGAQAVFVEVPVGSQSAAAMKGYGVCVALLAALRSEGLQFFELTPEEVKRAATGNPLAKKKAMIDWATSLYPEINWPTYTRNGMTLITADQAEHMSDAVGAIHAGVINNQFLQLMSLMRAA